MAARRRLAILGLLLLIAGVLELVFPYTYSVTRSFKEHMERIEAHAQRHMAARRPTTTQEGNRSSGGRNESTSSSATTSAASPSSTTAPSSPPRDSAASAATTLLRQQQVVVRAPPLSPQSAVGSMDSAQARPPPIHARDRIRTRTRTRASILASNLARTAATVCGVPGGGDSLPPLTASAPLAEASIHGVPRIIWTFWDYARPEDVSPTTELNLRTWRRHLPGWRIVRVNHTNIENFIPDLPGEFFRMPYPAVKSDIARAGLLFHHGGLYMDTDFIVFSGVKDTLRELETNDVVTYGNKGQVGTRCRLGNSAGSAPFASNFMATRKGNAFSEAWWLNMKGAMRRVCRSGRYNASVEQVCCHGDDVDTTTSSTSTVGGKDPPLCHIPWGRLELLKHATPAAVFGDTELILHTVDAEGPRSPRMYCAPARSNFIPAGGDVLWARFASQWERPAGPAGPAGGGTSTSTVELNGGSKCRAVNNAATAGKQAAAGGGSTRGVVRRSAFFSPCARTVADDTDWQCSFVCGGEGEHCWGCPPGGKVYYFAKQTAALRASKPRTQPMNSAVFNLLQLQEPPPFRELALPWMPGARPGAGHYEIKCDTATFAGIDPAVGTAKHCVCRPPMCAAVTKVEAAAEAAAKAGGRVSDEDGVARTEEDKDEDEEKREKQAEKLSHAVPLVCQKGTALKEGETTKKRMIPNFWGMYTDRVNCYVIVK